MWSVYVTFLAHLSLKLKWAFLILWCRLSIHLFFCLYTFHIFISSRTTGPISTKRKGIQVCSNERPHLFWMGDNWEVEKLNWQHLKIFFSRTNLNQTWHKHPGVGQFQPNLVCPNKGSLPFHRGDNYEIPKIHWQTFIVLIPETSGSVSTKLGSKHPWVSEGDSRLFT